MATLVSNSFIGNSSIRRYIYTASSVNASTTSDELELKLLVTYGTIVGVGVICPTSVDFDISLRQKTGITPPDVDEILKVENVNTGSYKENLTIPFQNMDTTEIEKLYLKITNTDGAHATGAITIELLIQEV